MIFQQGEGRPNSPYTEYVEACHVQGCLQHMVDVSHSIQLLFSVKPGHVQHQCLQRH
jgi:hypothetical protein